MGGEYHEMTKGTAYRLLGGLQMSLSDDHHPFCWMVSYVLFGFVVLSACLQLT